MPHSNISQGDWKKVKSEIQKTWSGIPGDELERTHGDFKALSGLVQKKYGLKREEAERKLDEVIARCGTAAGSPSVRSSEGPSSSGSSKSSRSERR